MDKGRRDAKNGSTFTVGELAAQAGVTSRTVRFYVAQGLLPPPVGAGRAAVYTAEHLIRLKLIRLLKEEFLPLAEIRDLLAGLTQAEIEELLAQKGRPAPPPKPERAQEYIQTLLQTGPEAAGSPAMLRQVVAEHKRAHSGAAASGDEGAPVAGAGQAVTWGRILLHPDVELNVRHPPTDARTPARVQQLLQAARRLFKS